MKWVMVPMVLLLAALQYRYWFGDASVREIEALEGAIEQQQEVNASLQRRNEHRMVEVRELHSGVEGIEAMAREEMGMIKEGETFFLLIPEHASAAVGHASR